MQVSKPVASPKNKILTAVRVCDGNTMSEQSRLHSELIGCQLIDQEESWKQAYQRYERKICLTHNLVVCRCGWERGWHFDTDSRAIFRSVAQAAHSLAAKVRWKIKSS